MPYARRVDLRVRQIIQDVGFLVWIVAWFRVGQWVHDLVSRLGTPPERLAEAGRALESAGGRGSDAAGELPLIGDRLSGAIGRVGDGGTALVRAGETSGAAASDLAFALSLLVTLLPIAWLAARYLPRRIRWMLEAGAAERIVSTAGGVELLALRALTNQPLGKLRRVDPDPRTAFHDGRFDGLAALELRRLGLDAAGPDGLRRSSPGAGRRAARPTPPR